MYTFKKIFLSLLILSMSNVHAQNIGINTSNPDASAALEIKSSNKGLLIPRVSLASATDNITIPSPATSLLVYNTNASLPNGTGFYFNNGTVAAPQWKVFATGGFSIPYSTVYNSVNPLFSLSNNSTGSAAEFFSNNTGSSAALKASTASTQTSSAAVHALSGSSGLAMTVKTGLLGESNGTGTGVTGMSQSGDGILGLSNAQSKAGVHGKTTADFGYGVLGQSFGNGTGGFFSSTTGRALVTDGAVQMNNTGVGAGKVLMTDASGNAHWEGAVAFVARFDTTIHQVVNPDVIIPFHKEDFDISSSFTLRSALINPNSFTAPVAGIYQFDVDVFWIGDPNSSMVVRFLKNGADLDLDFSFDDRTDGNIYGNITINRKIKMAGGDKITLKASTYAPTYQNQVITNVYFSGNLLFRL